MATYYVELDGGQLQADAALKGGTMSAAVSFSGAVIYPSQGGGGGGANLETKSVSYTPSELELSQTLLPSAGYDGFDEVDVSVDAIPSNYVGSGVPRRDSLDLTTSGATVNVPSGFYEYNSSATIPSAPLPTLSSATIDNSGNLGVTANLSGDGYLQSGTLPLTLANAFTVQGAQTITPTTTDQTISADQYLTGNQTILGDADLVASNIKKDVEIFGVTGTYEGGQSEDYFFEMNNFNFGNNKWSFSQGGIAPIRLSAIEYFEIAYQLTEFIDYPNLFGMGANITQWSTAELLIYIENTIAGTSEKVVIRQSGTNVIVPVTPRELHKIRITKDYIYVDGVQAVATNSALASNSSPTFGSQEGTKRFTGTILYMRAKKGA